MKKEEKLETGCMPKKFIKHYVSFETVEIKDEKQTYFFPIHEKEKQYFLTSLLEKYATFISAKEKDEIRNFTFPFLYKLLCGKVYLDELKRYLQNEIIEKLEKEKWSIFCYDPDILYDAHIPLDMKKALIRDFLTLCFRYSDIIKQKECLEFMRSLGINSDNNKSIYVNNVIPKQKVLYKVAAGISK